MFSFVTGIWNWKPIPDPTFGLGFATDLNVLKWEFALGDPYQILSSIFTAFWTLPMIISEFSEYIPWSKKYNLHYRWVQRAFGSSKLKLS